jgi:hypothetical protein
MSVAEKWLGAIAAIAMVTTLILPGRQTVGVIDAGRKLLQGTLGTAMGTIKTI